MLNLPLVDHTMTMWVHTKQNEHVAHRDPLLLVLSTK